MSMFSQMQTSVTVKRPTFTQGTAGEIVSTQATASRPDVKIYELSAREQLVLLREGVRSTHKLLARADVDIQAKDEVWETDDDGNVSKYTVNTVTMETVGKRDHHIEVNMTLIT